jgi:hypothetical protein
MIFSFSEGKRKIITLDEAQHLARIDRHQSRLPELRFFGGSGVEEVGEAMGLSTLTIKREWRTTMREWRSAHAWLYQDLATARSR